MMIWQLIDVFRNGGEIDIAHTLAELAATAVVLIFCLPVHEFAHAWAAKKLGDDTAWMHGRLTLNPSKHLDLMGTLMILFVGFGYAKPVPVQINVDRELIEEAEEKDVAFYGIEGLIARATARQQLSLQRELERSFFAKANASGTALTPSGTAIHQIIEGVIQQIETTKNDFVDGVPRDMIHLICDTNTYGLIRDDLDRGVQNANVNTAIAEFGTYHGVRIYSSVYLPVGVKVIGMCHGSVAQPIKLSLADPIKVQLSDAYAFGLFFYYGVEAVMPDLIVTYS